MSIVWNIVIMQLYNSIKLKKVKEFLYILKQNCYVSYL